MTTIGFSRGPNTIRVAQREDFLVFFETIKNVHLQGFRRSVLTRFIGKGQFPLIVGKLWRGSVPYDEMENLEDELRLAKEIFSNMPLSMVRMEELTEETDLYTSVENLGEVFAPIFNKLTRSISGSRGYYELGESKYPVRTIVAEIPACSTMLRLPEEAFFKLDEPPLWTFYNESRENVIVLDGSDW